MTDRRELILARILVIAGGIDIVKTAARNRPNIPDTDLPAVILYDSDEIDDEDDPGKGRVPADAPRRIIMQPSIEIMVSDSAKDVGTTVNAIRAALIGGIMLDATLQSYVTDQRNMRYLGCVSGVALGRSMMGNMALRFSFAYALRPHEL